MKVIFTDYKSNSEIESLLVIFSSLFKSLQELFSEPQSQTVPFTSVVNFVGKSNSHFSISQEVAILQ